MITNLDKLYKMDQDLEKNGVWFEVAEGASILIRRFGGDNSQAVKAALAKYYKPVQRQVEIGALDEKKEREITTQVFVESSVIDWKGIIVDGKEQKFSVENAVNLLLSLPELYVVLHKQASSMEAYKAELGNV